MGPARLRTMEGSEPGQCRVLGSAWSSRERPEGGHRGRANLPAPTASPRPVPAGLRLSRGHTPFGLLPSRCRACAATWWSGLGWQAA